ncbi:MAG: D-hexose-6-phosphate mutarotase [Pseudomonadota bacterium]
MSATIDALNASFGQGDALYFVSGPGDLAQAVLRAQGAEARVMLQGAQIIHYHPAHQEPVIWLGEEVKYLPGKSVRGGVPVCWPWFGAGADGRPAHGFARNLDWRVEHAATEHGESVLTLTLMPSEDTRKFWPHDFRLALEVRLGDRLRMTLDTEHLGSEPCEITQGLHTYLRVGDIAQAAILGLGDTPYLDKTRDMIRDVQHEQVLRLSGETDRVYLDTLAEVIVEDPVLRRRIHVSKDGSRSTVIWNPWEEKAGAFPDMRADEYRHMVCVETVNAAEDRVLLAPGGTHRMVCEIHVTPLE